MLPGVHHKQLICWQQHPPQAGNGMGSEKEAVEAKLVLDAHRHLCSFTSEPAPTLLPDSSQNPLPLPYPCSLIQSSFPLPVEHMSWASYTWCGGDKEKHYGGILWLQEIMNKSEKEI